MHFYTSAFQRGNSIYYTGYENGQRVKRKVSYKPYLFLPDTSKTFGTFQNPNPPRYETLDGQPCNIRRFDNIFEANKFVRDYKDIENFPIYGNTSFLYTWINDTFPGHMKYDSSLINIIFLDIEVESDKGLPQYRNPIYPINAITISKNRKKITFGCREYKPKGKNSVYIPCKNEKVLLQKFLSIWNDPHYNPDVLTGWHIEGFDVPYLYNRIKKVLGENDANKLSPWGVVEEKEISYRFKPGTDLIYDLKGISVLDYLQLYRKFSFKNQESYSLNFIANAEIGEKKTDYSEYENLVHLYNEDFEKFIDYNIRDVELVEKLDDKLKLLEQVFAISYDSKVTYTDTLATLRVWDTIIHNYLLDMNIVVPQQKRFSGTEELIGGYVKEPQLGMHRWVVSFDLTSLYPHLIMQYNIGPDTFLQKLDLPLTLDDVVDGKLTLPNTLTSLDSCCTANLCLYRKDKKGFLAALMERIFNDRAAYSSKLIEHEKEYQKTKDPELKKEMAQCEYMQMALKILMNSGYGAVANQYFRFYDHDNAEAVTASGQLAVRWVGDRINKYLNGVLKTDGVDYIIASDTDSVYINFEPIVKAAGIEDKPKNVIVEAIDQWCKKKLSPFIDKAFEELAEYTNAVDNKMFMKREVIADKGIWTAKKRYILNVWDSKGVRYTEPKLKISGIESVRSSTPSACRKYIKNALKIIMLKDEHSLQKFIRESQKEFNTLPIDEIAFPRSISGLDKYSDSSSIYAKSTPIQVKGSLIYNNLVSEKGLDKKYPMIYNGDKIKFVYLKTPNPLQEHVVSFINVLPKEFRVDKFIDFNTQFNKGFLDPISTVLDAIGWKAEETADLSEWI